MSGRFTNQEPCDSGLLIVTPLRVVLMRVWSMPRMLMYVAPSPVPASEVVVIEGIISNRLLTLPLPCCALICGIEMVVTLAAVCTVGFWNSMVTSSTVPCCVVSGCCANTVPGNITPKIINRRTVMGDF